jgi:hypothetical protein
VKHKDLILKLSRALPNTRATKVTALFLPDPLKNALRTARRHLHLTAMQRVLDELSKRGIVLKDLSALEVFGCSGDGHLKDYASLVSTLEIWEIDPQFETILKKNFPNATVKITDSYQEIKRAQRKFDLIVIDNGTSTRTGGYCEHFDLFPDVFRVASDSCVLIIDVIPEIDDKDSKDYPYLFNDQQLERRRAFYKTNRPEKVNCAEMIKIYKEISRVENFIVDWHFFERRSFIHYLALHLTRSRRNHPGEVHNTA